MILITGGNGNLANSLKEYLDGDFYGKDMLDLTDRNCISNLPNYEILIHTATGNKRINENYTIDTEKLIQTIPNMTDYLRRGWFLKITHGYYWESAELMSENSCYSTYQNI